MDGRRIDLVGEMMFTPAEKLREEFNQAAPKFERTQESIRNLSAMDHGATKIKKNFLPLTNWPWK
jgi:hypothetical protein